MDAETILDITQTLIGPINSVGESHVDTKRLANLEKYTYVVKGLVARLAYCATYGDSSLFSVKEASELAFKTLKEIKEIVEDLSPEKTWFVAKLNSASEKLINVYQLVDAEDLEVFFDEDDNEWRLDSFEFVQRVPK